MTARMINIKNDLTIGVYLGSCPGNIPELDNSIVLLGEGIVQLRYSLVYGGSNTGLMGLLAKTVKRCGGNVIGITTHHLSMNREMLFTEADEIIVADSMYDRKRLIHERASRFIVMPGGVGTFDELFETWCQIKIGVMQKEIGVVNINGYFDLLLDFINNCEKNGFLTASDKKVMHFYNDVSACIEDLAFSKNLIFPKLQSYYE